jgi:hypothetical protein
MATRMVFGRKGLGAPTPLIIKAVLKWVKRVCLGATVLSIVSVNEYLSYALVAITWLVDEIEPLFGEVSKPNDSETIEVK